MRKYASVKGNSFMLFKNREDAINHVQENPDREYREYKEWRYYSPKSHNPTTSHEAFTGNTFEEAIEASLQKIIKAVGFSGVSGYTLNSVTLIDNFNGTATLKITGWSVTSILVGFRKEMLSEENMKTINVEIIDLEDGDIPNGKIEWEIVKSR